MSIKENLETIKEQLGNNNVKIIAVTKYATVQQVIEAYNLGIRDFGENYVQDALEKISRIIQEYSVKDINWHFLGRLQKNKVKNVVGKFLLIHSIDSVELAELINKQASKTEKIQDILLQINTSKEETKSGFYKNDIVSSFEKISSLKNIRIKGLMTMAPRTEYKEKINECFTELSNLKKEINKIFSYELKELSMGMTNDYNHAVECGATMIRIGKGLFKEGRG